MPRLTYVKESKRPDTKLCMKLVLKGSQGLTPAERSELASYRDDDITLKRFARKVIDMASLEPGYLKL